MENKTSSEINPRELVLTMLLKTIEEGRFSHLVKKEYLSSDALERQSKIFAERLYQGVLEKVILLDWIISSYSSVKIEKMKPVIRNILRMCLYQMLYMDAVPDHAAINEAVRLTKKKGLKGLVPFVNGLLRSFQRGGIKPGMPEHVKHSAPLWLYNKESEELGKEQADLFFDEVSSGSHSLSARLSLSRSSREEILALLKEDGCSIEEVPGIEEAVRLSGINRLTSLKAWQEGLIYLQDISSIQVGKTAGELLADTKVRNVLDVCAAPGGKSLHLAELFPEAKVLARDLSPAKTKLIEENISRSRLNNIRAEVHDALSFDETLEGRMDLVLCDLPCSGLGVMGRKPDIKLRIKEEDLEELAALQKKILSTVCHYVKTGGMLIYSTCTVNRMENQDNASWFEKEFPFTMILEKQFLPGRDLSDGFYLAVFKQTL